MGMIYSFEGFDLDVERCELRSGSTVHHLEPQAFDVLAHLVRHPDRLVSRDELLDEVWGHRFVTPATVDSRIKAARRAVGDDGRAQRVIRTIRGRGFRLVVPVAARGSGPGAREETSGDGGASASGNPPGPDPRSVPVEAPVSELPPASLRTPPHLVAKPRELALLDPVLAAVRSGVRQAVLVSGEPGIGKSTFLGMLARGLQADGFRVAMGQCIDQGRTCEPYLPVLDALTRAGRGEAGVDVRDTLARFAPSWLPGLPSLAATLPPAAGSPSGPPPEARMMREMVIALEALALDRPTALLLEDLHWADRSTLDLIHWVTVRPESSRLLLVGTYRSSESDPGLRTILGRIRASDRCTHLPLTPWTIEDVGSYLSSRFPGHGFSDDLARLAWARGAGNPLFTRSLVDGWVRAGDLVDRGHGWRVETDPDSLARHIPASLNDAVEQQVGRLARTDQDLLEAGSVVGRGFPTSLVATIAGCPGEEAEERLVRLARTSMLIRRVAATSHEDTPGPSRFEFDHDLYREALYRRIPDLRRCRLHREVGRRMEAEGDAEPGELAHHFLRGGDLERAVGHLTTCARDALARSAYREAGDRIELALGVIRRNSGLPNALERELDLQRMLGPVRLELGGWRDPGAEAAYRRAREIAEALGDARRLAEALYGLAYLHEIRGEYDRAQDLVRERGELQASESRDRDLLEMHDQLSCSFFHQGRFRASLASAERALGTELGASPEPETLNFGHHPAVSSRYWAGTARWFLGEPDRALALVLEARDLCRSLDHPPTLAFVETRVARLHHFRREPDGVRAHAERALELAEVGGYPYQRALAVGMLGWCTVRDGDAEGGLRLLRQSLERQRELGTLMDYPYGLGLLAECLLSVEGHREALDAAEEGLAIVEAAGGRFFWSAELMRLRGRALLSLGRRKEGRAALREGLRIARQQESAPLELRAAIALLRHGPRSRREEMLGTLLAPAVRRFGKEVDTPDLREARALLSSAGELAVSPVTG